jgi:hypothetical protein
MARVFSERKIHTNTRRNDDVRAVAVLEKPIHKLVRKTVVRIVNVLM